MATNHANQVEMATNDANKVESTAEKLVQMQSATKSATDFVGSKNGKIEERLMYQDLEVHECLRMLVICIFEYTDKASDLDWMTQICLRELCKLEKRTREEVVVTHLKYMST